MGRIVILTGAGISAESGLSTFRDADGIWTKVRLEDVATPEAFERDPNRVQAFYNMRRAGLRDAQPNPAHVALARLSTARDLSLITQNVDDLHERGGAPEVIHMHGELMRALCAVCSHRWDAPWEMSATDKCPNCGVAATRPDIVWFGEMPYHMDRIATLLAEATIFASIGTSAQVWPAAGFVLEAREAGAHCVELNLESTDMSDLFHEHIIGPASEIVPYWVDCVIGPASDPA